MYVPELPEIKINPEALRPASRKDKDVLIDEMDQFTSNLFMINQAWTDLIKKFLSADTMQYSIKIEFIMFSMLMPMYNYH